MNVFTRGVRNAFRNGVRTISIVLILGLSVGLAISMLLARQAVDAKIESVKGSIGNTISVSPAGVRGFEGGGEPLTEDQLAAIENIDHVSAVNSTLSDRLTSANSNLESSITAGTIGERFGGGGAGLAPTTNSDGAVSRPSFSPPVNVTGTTDATSVSSIGEVDLTAGEQIDGTSSLNVALIGAGLAETNDLKVGSTFKAYDTDITVKGIIDSTDNRFAGNSVIMPLATLQTLSGQTGAVNAATVTVDSIDNVDSTLATIQTKLGDSVDAVSQQDTAESAVAPLESIKSVTLFGLISSVVAGGVIIMLTMIMIVRERRREIGVLKAIGASDGKVALQFMVESVTLTLLAAVIGIFIGLVAANPITDTLVNNASSSSAGSAVGGPGGGMGMRGAMASGFNNLKDISAIISWDIVLYGLVAALLIALVGSFVASWFITKISPAEAIRSE